MKTVVLIGKGGGGKSSTAINLGVVAHQHGFKVGLVDADPQGSVRDWRYARGTKDIPVRSCQPDELEATLGVARRAAIAWLFLDMPPHLGAHTLTAIRAADLVLLPMRPMRFDISVTRQRIALLRSTARPFGVVINGAPPRREGQDAPMVRDARAVLRDIGAHLWRGQITHRHVIPNALIAGQGVAETEPMGPAAAEYTELWRAIVRTTDTRRITHEHSSSHAA
jgi:chromosome partitioning protein